jgi:F-type H+-transporting ATPase subunit gamma
MATLLDFRRRIRSVKNTQQITRAMKFVAAARLRRAQEAAIAARPYAKELARMLRSIMSRISEPEHPLLAKRPEERILALVLTGERGLAGAFNANILRKAQDFFRANKGKKISTIPVGKKGRDSLKKAGFGLIAEYVNVLARVDFATAREIATLVTELYTKDEIDSVYIVFSEFKTVMTPNLVITKILPVEAVHADEESATEAESSQVDYIYEQPVEQLLGKLLPRYIETQILRAMLESSAAEHAARMTAMESAT